MFFHNFKYSLKTLLKDKSLIFWTFAFPLILGTFFHMAFKDIAENDKLKTIDIAVINSEEFNNNVIYKTTFDFLSKGDEKLFNTKYVTETKAKKLLKDKKIVGYLELKNNDPVLTINSNGINETIFKYVVDELEEARYIIGSTSKEIDYKQIYQTVEAMLNDNIEYDNKSKTDVDVMMVEFYTLIAMTCLYGAMLSMAAVNKVLPDMTNVGKRISVSPTKKMKLVFSSLLSSYLVQLVGLILLYLYTIFALNVDYGNHLEYIILLSLVGSLAGLSLGLFVSTVVKTSENGKLGIILSISMVGVFFAGMMGVTMKYIIDKNIPLLNKINPANMITDGFYSLYYYDTFNRYYFDIISLLLFSFILILLSYNSLRRQKYDSI